MFCENEILVFMQYITQDSSQSVFMLYLSFFSQEANGNNILSLNYTLF